MKCLGKLSLFGGMLAVLASCGADTDDGAAATTAATASETQPVAELVSGDSVAAYSYTPGFRTCQFNFGASWTSEDDDLYYSQGAVSQRLTGMDYISVWLGDNEYYNSFEEHMVETCYNIGATPMIYAYVIAEYDKDQGIVDCDVKRDSTTMTHCTDGARMIRQHFDEMLLRYQAYAAGMRSQLEFASQNGELKVLPTEFETIWLIEPDFYQYSESGSIQKAAYDSVAQIGGGIPDAQMGLIFKQIVDTIRTYLPAAKIAVDLSPWVEDLASWYSNFDWSIIDYVGTSGGRTMAGSTKIKGGNPATWAGVYAMTGKPILADAGYGAGGTGEGHATVWDVPENINARIADGVAGVMQMDAAQDYNVRLQTIRPQLVNVYPWCQN